MKEIKSLLPKEFEYKGHKYNFCWIGCKFINLPDQVGLQVHNMDKSTYKLLENPFGTYYEPTEESTLFSVWCNTKEEALREALKWWEGFKNETD